VPEPLTTSLVLEELAKLHIAFPQNIGMRTNASGTAETYRNGLRGLSGDSIRAAADRSIQEDQFFPKVARLRELATAWMRHNQPVAEPTQTAEQELWCPRCRTRAILRNRWRPKTDDHHRPILTRDAAYLLLEPYVRELCECGRGCDYAPIAGVEPPAMRVQDAPLLVLTRGVLTAPQPAGVPHVAA